MGIVVGLLVALGVKSLIDLLLMLAWNYVIHDSFGGPEVGYWLVFVSTLALSYLGNLIFRRGGGEG